MKKSKKEKDYHALLTIYGASKMSPKLTRRLVEWLRTTADNLLKNEADQYADIFKARLMK